MIATSPERARAPGTSLDVVHEPAAASPRPRQVSRLTWRIFFANAAAITTVLAVALVLVSWSAERTARDASNRALERTRGHISALLRGREQALESGALVFAQNAPFFTLMQDKVPGDALDQSQEAASRIGATWVQITDEQGVRLAKSDEPTAPRDSLAAFSLIRRALAGDVATGIGASADSVIFQAVAVPVKAGTRLTAVLMAVQSIDSVFAAEVKAQTGSDAVFFVTDTSGAPHLVASTLDRSAPLRAFLARYAAHRAGEDTSTSLGRAELSLDRRRYVAQGERLRSAGGAALGGVVALHLRDEELAPFLALRRRLLLAAAIGLTLAFALSYVVAHQITRPLLSLIAVARRAASGDLSGKVEVHTGDEIGALQGAVRSMLSTLRERQTLAELVTAGATATAARQHATRGWSGPLAPGRRLLDRYTILDSIGEGGMGVVYKAIDDELGEVIALKMLRSEVLSADPSAIERLKSEIRLARRISHRNVVRIHDLGEVNGAYFISMEYVAGTTLRTLVDERGVLPEAAVVAVGKQLCRALEGAHEQGVIHRDIKPHNLIVQPDGAVKVMDFGIARLAVREGGLTQAGTAVGTPDYMAPEQLLGEEVDARADLYAAGVVLYECLTGRIPFAGVPAIIRLGRQLTERAVPPHEVNASVSASLSALVMRVIAADRDERPRSATELLDALAQAEN